MRCILTLANTSSTMNIIFVIYLSPTNANKLPEMGPSSLRALVNGAKISPGRGEFGSPERGIGWWPLGVWKADHTTAQSINVCSAANEVFS